MSPNVSTSAYRLGVFWAVLCNSLWSTTFIGAKYLMEKKAIDPVSLSLIRFLIGGSILLALGFWLHGKNIYRISAMDYLRLAGLAALGIVGMSVFLFWGQCYTTAINSALVLQVNPILILLMGAFFGYRITLRQIGGILIALIGCAFVLNVISPKGIGYDPTGIRGDGLVLLSAICWAVYSVLGKGTVTRVGGYISTTWTMLFGAAELWAVQLVTGTTTLPSAPVDWGIILCLALFPTALGFYAWYEAWARIDLSLLNVMQYLTPLCTMILAAFVLGERVTLLNVCGAGAILFGVFMIGGPMKGGLKARIQSMVANYRLKRAASARGA